MAINDCELNKNDEKIEISKTKEKCTNFIKKSYSTLLIDSNCLTSNYNINTFIIFFTGILIIWVVVFSIDSNFALPGSSFYSIWILFTFGHILSYLSFKIRLPGLLGMLLVGIITANLSYIKVEPISLDTQTSSFIRKMSLCVILCRAGFGINVSILKRIKLQVLKLSCLPVMFEAISFSIVNKFILNVPFEWSFLLGFAISGVSPAVIIPYMLDFQERGIGTNKGIPTLFVASASFDNIIAITGNSVMLGIVFSQGQLWWNIVKAPIQIIIGILAGIILGFLLNLVRISHTLHVTILRFILLLLFASFLLFGSQKINFSSIGPLGVLCLAMTAKIVWLKIDSLDVNLIEKNYVTKVSAIFNKLWIIIFEPLLFTSIGNEILFQNLDGKSIGLGIASLVIGICFRFAATFLSSTCAHFNLKEKLFICISWLPKATVQAAVGSLALDIAKANKNDEQIKLGNEVLTIAVISILLTAPIGAFLINLLGPRLLTQENKQFEDEETAL